MAFKNCPQCKALITTPGSCVYCGWEKDKIEYSIKQKTPCHFQDGKCRSDHDRFNRSSPPKGATIRVNDYWICNWHYEHGFDRMLRNGETMSTSELKIQNRLFGTNIKSIQEE